MNIKLLSKMVASAAVAVAVGQALAAVSPEEAKQLGTTLTPMGAEVKGNADGTIPAYTGGYTQLPAGYKKGDPIRPDPFASDKPRLTITQANMAQYEGNMAASSKELLKRFKDFRMDIYPTRRSAAFPQFIYDNVKKNATNAKTADEGLVLKDALPGVPFPIPKTGNEAMWNHLLRFTTPGFNFRYDVYNVDRSGTATLSTTAQLFQEWPIYAQENLNKILEGSDVYYRVKVAYSAPVRRAGEALIVKDYVDPLNSKRRAWQYLPGQRRVKEAPDVNYDTPNPGNSGVATYDDAFVYNGAMDRYDMKLIGKKEVYIPYNGYRWTYSTKEDNFTTPNFPNPDKLRWELHRVWVVEATLKPGKRHIYAKRVFYLDEDTWFALMADNYDARGDLFRSTSNNVTMVYDQGAPMVSGQWHQDFTSGTYSASGVNIGSYGGVKFQGISREIDWSPDALAGSGVR